MLPRSRMDFQAANTAQGQGVSGVRRHKPDYWLIALSVLLMSIGLVVVYSISPALGESANVSANYLIGRQLIAVAFALVAFWVTARIPLDKWRKLYKPLLILAIAVSVLALIMPVDPDYPAHRWVRLAGFSFQSVELVKFVVLIWLASMLAERMKTGGIKDTSATLKPLGIALLAIGIVVAGVQSDLGSTAVMMVMMGAMAFVAGLPLKKLIIIGVGIAVAFILFTAAIPYRRERMMAYFHPSSGSCQSASGYQACQAQIAVGSGGMAGLGLGRSVQAYGYLPEAANDSIFAIYAEKFGFIGSVILLGIFTAFFYRIKNVAERVNDDFSRLIVVGIFSWLSFQAIINIGAMLGVLPLKGITLPFVSYGGTSVVFVAAAVGLVFQISRYTNMVPVRLRSKGARYDHRRNGRRVRGAYHPDFSRSPRT